MSIYGSSLPTHTQLLSQWHQLAYVNVCGCAVVEQEVAVKDRGCSAIWIILKEWVCKRRLCRSDSIFHVGNSWIYSPTAEFEISVMGPAGVLMIIHLYRFACSDVSWEQGAWRGRRRSRQGCYWQCRWSGLWCQFSERAGSILYFILCFSHSHTFILAKWLINSASYCQPLRIQITFGKMSVKFTYTADVSCNKWYFAASRFKNRASCRTFCPWAVIEIMFWVLLTFHVFLCWVFVSNWLIWASGLKADAYWSVKKQSTTRKSENLIYHWIIKL